MLYSEGELKQGTCKAGSDVDMTYLPGNNSTGSSLEVKESERNGMYRISSGEITIKEGSGSAYQLAFDLTDGAEKITAGQRRYMDGRLL